MKLVLASQSPRRRQILRIAGFEFDILPSQISEIPDENLNLDQRIRQLAIDKAEACLKMGKTPKGQGFLILAADTVVALGDQVLGKPKDENEARQILRRLSGQTHVVITGLAMIDVDTDRRLEAHERTTVEFRELSDQEIDHYVQTGDPMDKAGAYGIQSEARSFVKKLEGHYDNVVGLPMKAVESMFEKLAVAPPKRESRIEHGLHSVQESIREELKASHSRSTNVKLVAVSKKKSAEDVLQAIEAGQRIFGENYVQELLDKKLEVEQLLSMRYEKPPSIEWHFIGNIQSKKLKSLVGNVDLIHSVDSLDHLLEIEKRGLEKKIQQKILVQVRIGNEDSKSGADSASFLEILKRSNNLSSVQVCGVMALPPLADSETVARAQFREVVQRFNEGRALISDSRRAAFSELSMGTSSDYRSAIAEGATLVRVGTAIFGERT